MYTCMHADSSAEGESVETRVNMYVIPCVTSSNVFWFTMRSMIFADGPTKLLTSSLCVHATQLMMSQLLCSDDNDENDKKA